MEQSKQLKYYYRNKKELNKKKNEENKYLMRLGRLARKAGFVISDGELIKKII